MTVIPFPAARSRTKPARFTDAERYDLERLAFRMARHGWAKHEFRRLCEMEVFYVWYDDAPKGHATVAEGCQRLALIKDTTGSLLSERPYFGQWEDVLKTSEFTVALIALGQRGPR